MREIKFIVVHCSANRESQAPNIDGRDIDRYHREKRGWFMCGYHHIVNTDGTVEDWRSHERQGAHALGFNHNSIGVCYIGGLDDDGEPKDTRTEPQAQSLYNLLIELKTQYPDAIILGHRDLSPDKDGDGVVEQHEWLKDCPCFDAISEYEDLNDGDFNSHQQS